MQLSFKKQGRTARSPVTLAELKRGEHGIIDHIDLPTDVAQRLMELGFLPGTQVTRALSAPGGDPRVFRVDGSEIALRRETAAKLLLRRGARTVACSAPILGDASPNYQTNPKHGTTPSNGTKPNNGTKPK